MSVRVPSPVEVAARHARAVAAARELEEQRDLIDRDEYPRFGDLVFRNRLVDWALEPVGPLLIRLVGPLVCRVYDWAGGVRARRMAAARAAGRLVTVYPDWYVPR